MQQARDFSSREKALRQAQAEQERIFLLQIDVERKITLDLEQELRRSERVFQDEITGLRLEIERQKHANQLQAQQYNFDVSAAKTERESALQARNKIGARVFAMQQENDQLSRELAEIHEGLARMQGTISWRLLTPLRKLGVLGIPLPSVPNRRVAIGYDTPPSRQISDQLRTNYVHLEDANLYLGKNLESASVADSLETELTAADVAVNANADASSHAMVTNYEGLVQFEGRQFVEIAYLTLLKRQPDIDGLSFYLGRIQDGVTKLQILHEIFFSAECRGIGSELPG